MAIAKQIHAETRSPLLTPLLWSSFVNNTMINIVAFIVCQLFSQYMTGLIAEAAYATVSLKSNEITFLAKRGPWTHKSVLAMYGAAPLILGFLGTVSLWLFYNLWTVRGLLRVFLLWLTIHGINFFLGGLAVGILTKTGFGFVPSWLYIQYNVALVCTPFLFSILFLVGRAIYPLIMYTSIDLNFFEGKNRLQYLLASFLIPYLAGLIILLLLNMSEIPWPVILLYASAGIMPFASLLMVSQDVPRRMIEFNPEKDKFFEVKWLFFTVLALFIYIYFQDHEFIMGTL